MKRHLALVVAAALVAGPFAAGSAAAQSPKSCPEGRLSDGTCVNPAMAQDMRTTTIVMTQPKLSLTNPPVLPNQDGQYDLPRDHHEIANLHGSPPVTDVRGDQYCPGAGCVFVPRP